LLVNIVPALPSVPSDPNYVFKIPEFEKYLHAEATEKLRKASEELVGKTVKVRTLVGHGLAAEEIVPMAKAESVDLIVISTHGSTGLERFVFGSVAEKVVRLAECPVLTVRQKEQGN
jgi:nucleotide-binding universal stress UspA family protein